MASSARGKWLGATNLRLLAGVVGAAIIASYALAADGITPTAEQIGTIFCDARLANDMTPVEALQSPDLTAAIDKALHENAALQAQAPNEKPPLGDGIPWQSWQDAAPECKVAGVTETADSGAQVRLAYSFPDQPDANWVDTLVLASIDGKLLLDDIAYAESGTLRTTLVEAFNFND